MTFTTEDIKRLIPGAEDIGTLEGYGEVLFFSYLHHRFRNDKGVGFEFLTTRAQLEVATEALVKISDGTNWDDDCRCDVTATSAIARIKEIQE